MLNFRGPNNKETHAFENLHSRNLTVVNQTPPPEHLDTDEIQHFSWHHEALGGCWCHQSGWYRGYIGFRIGVYIGFRANLSSEIPKEA